MRKGYGTIYRGILKKETTFTLNDTIESIRKAIGREY